MSNQFHIARNGAPIGQFHPEQIEDLLNTGSLLLTDVYFDEVGREWIPLSQFKRKTPFASSKTPPDEPPTEITGEAEEKTTSKRRKSSGSRGHRKPHKRSPAESALPGWIACLFAIGIAAGIWAWAQGLSDRLTVSEDKVKSLTESLTGLQQQNAILLEMAPAGIVRGVMTVESVPGKLAVLSGVSLGLFKAEDVRDAMLRVVDNQTPINEQELASIVTTVQSALPSALAVTLSDSSGRFEMPVPGPGDYAIVSTAFNQSTGAPQRLLWALQIDDKGEPSPVLSLNEKNAITLRNPTMRMRPAR